MRHAQEVKSQGPEFIAQLAFSGLDAGTWYRFEVYLNGQPVSVSYPLQFQTLPQPDSFPEIRFALGSCAFTPEPYTGLPGDPNNHRFKIYTSINAQKPDFMLWLGDNVYLWEGDWRRKSDWKTMGGMEHRYTRTRSIPQLQPLLAQAQHYAIWDDHDYGANDANRNWAHKAQSLRVFKKFWANPGYPEKGGIYSSFRWADAEFFLTDGRWFRTSPYVRKSRREMLGKEQMAWLIENLKKSTATFKFICVGSQVLASANSAESYTRYKRERQLLLDAIYGANIPGVIFLDGDRHFSELSKLDWPAFYPLYAFTVSPLTSSASSGALNRNRVAGTLVKQENFGTISISGPSANRKLTLQVHDADGRVLWSREIAARELKR